MNVHQSIVLEEKTLSIPFHGLSESTLIEHLRSLIMPELGSASPVRLVINGIDGGGNLECDLGVMRGAVSTASIFDFRPREYWNTDSFNVVMVVPTGIGCRIGGHAGDATPACRLLASTCDTLVTHPNVVNASDINALPTNGLYVEGSTLARLLMGTIGLRSTPSNRILLVMSEHDDPEITAITVNAMNAARASAGISCYAVRMQNPVVMKTEMAESGRASGIVEGFTDLQVVLDSERENYDAVALASVIETPPGTNESYFGSSSDTIVNPWGGVEALLTHAVSLCHDVPTAHAPMANDRAELSLDLGRVEPRMAAEAVSNAFIHCVLSGLHQSPRICAPLPGGCGLTAEDIACLVIPDKCVGLPTLAALQQGIPVIAVRENQNLMSNDLSAWPFRGDKLFVVDNYLEAAGLLDAMRAGIDPATVRRPLTSAAERGL